MSDQVANRSAQGVTSVIRHTIKPGAEGEYEAWLNDLAAFGHSFPGHQGANIIRPADGGHT
jgi:antibiotic biosynthesis monooxygenase (ABM) superfamily enzyme